MFVGNDGTFRISRGALFARFCIFEELLMLRECRNMLHAICCKHTREIVGTNTMLLHGISGML